MLVVVSTDGAWNVFDGAVVALNIVDVVSPVSVLKLVAQKQIVGPS